MVRKILLGLLLALVSLPVLEVSAQPMLEPLDGERNKPPMKQLGKVFASNGVVISKTENDEGSIDHNTPATEAGNDTKWMAFRFSARELKTGERLYVVGLDHMFVGRAAFRGAVPRDLEGGYGHGQEAQLIRLDLEESCAQDGVCRLLEQMLVVFTPEEFRKYLADDGLVLKMVIDNDNFDLVRIPRDHIDGALDVAGPE